jgi:hypothetical protein
MIASTTISTKERVKEEMEKLEQCRPPPVWLDDDFRSDSSFEPPKEYVDLMCALFSDCCIFHHVLPYFEYQQNNSVENMENLFIE